MLKSLIAYRRYDHDEYRRELWAPDIKPVIARRATEHGSGLGKLRWVVDRTFALQHQSFIWQRFPRAH